MTGFFKKFVGGSWHGKPCKECGHGETSHHIKIIESEKNRHDNSQTIRLNCKECSCAQFK